MSGRINKMQRLDELEAGLVIKIEQLERAAADLRQKLSGYREARAAILGVPVDQPPTEVSKGRQNIKKTAMDVIAGFGGRGFTAADVVTQAQVRGRSIKIDSVRSMLSRLKADGALRFEDGLYSTPVKGATAAQTSTTGKQETGATLFRVA